MLRGLFFFLWFMSIGAVSAEPLRIALFNAELDRKGPGLLLRDIVAGKDEQVAASIDLLAIAQADIFVQ